MDLKTYIAGKRGRAATLAVDLGVSPSYLSQMANGISPTSPERCVEIEKATEGAVTRKDLRPNDWERIWPELATPSAQRRKDDPEPGPDQSGESEVPQSRRNLLECHPARANKPSAT